MDTVNNFPQGGQMIKVRISQSKGHLYENYNMHLASAIVYNYSHVTDSNVMASFVRNFSLKLKTEFRATPLRLNAVIGKVQILYFL